MKQKLQFSSLEKLHIPNPCPVYYGKDIKPGEGFHCKGCDKVVMDFSQMTVEELINCLKPNTCGIFRPDQLKAQKEYTFLKRFAFYSLMFFSFLGFNVKPMQASTTVLNDSTKNQKEESIYLKDKGKPYRVQKREYKRQEKEKKRYDKWYTRHKFRPLGGIEF